VNALFTSFGYTIENLLSFNKLPLFTSLELVLKKMMEKWEFIFGSTQHFAYLLNPEYYYILSCIVKTHTYRLPLLAVAWF